jgi:hypothetical protein
MEDEFKCREQVAGPNVVERSDCGEERREQVVIKAAYGIAHGCAIGSVVIAANGRELVLRQPGR